MPLIVFVCFVTSIGMELPNVVLLYSRVARPLSTASYFRGKIDRKCDANERGLAMQDFLSIGVHAFDFPIVV